MIIERTESPRWTTDHEGGQGILIDGSGTVEPRSGDVFLGGGT